MAVAAVPPVILVNDLVKTFGDVTAVAGVSFSVGAGEIFGFLGPNGAGKSTTIKMLSTLVRPTSGRATLAGYDIARQSNEVRQAIGLVFQDPSLDNRLTADENLKFHAMLYNVPAPVFRTRADAVLAMVDLADRRQARVATFSGGMKRRLEIARGLLHDPKVLFLDEPTIGLDVQTRNAIWTHVRGLREQVGTTVFMTTHYMAEAENCDRIAIVDRGRIQAIDSPAALKRSIGGDTVVVSGDDALAGDIESRYGVSTRRSGADVSFQIAAGAEFVPHLVADFGGRIKAVQVKPPTLDDVFLTLTGRAIRAEEGSSTLETMRQGAGLRGRR
jgi:ABC-2 type transport system ATP-binding protein